MRERRTIFHFSHSLIEVKIYKGGLFRISGPLRDTGRGDSCPVFIFWININPYVKTLSIGKLHYMDIEENSYYHLYLFDVEVENNFPCGLHSTTFERIYRFLDV